jgi:hypothetical protein
LTVLGSTNDCLNWRFGCCYRACTQSNFLPPPPPSSLQLAVLNGLPRVAILQYLTVFETRLNSHRTTDLSVPVSLAARGPTTHGTCTSTWRVIPNDHSTMILHMDTTGKERCRINQGAREGKLRTLGSAASSGLPPDPSSGWVAGTMKLTVFGSTNDCLSWRFGC